MMSNDIRCNQVKRRTNSAHVFFYIVLLLITACAPDNSAEPEGGQVEAMLPDIIATNAFYYYADVHAAWAFYRDTLGFETVADYGFAKILRLADSSYLTLVQADSGMHSTAEPKTVTLSLITDQLQIWYDHLQTSQVPMRVDFAPQDDQRPNSFVAVDPEGYFLKFVRHNPHPNHAAYVAAFSDATPVTARIDNGASELSIRAVAFSAYFDDLDKIVAFYESLFNVSAVAQLDGAPLYQMSGSGFLALVAGGDELHQATEENGVTLSFLTTDVDGWFDRATNWIGFELRTPEILNESDLVRVFVGYDPSGIFLEWDTFLDLPGNEELMKYLNR
jgi:catechol 2,3-dioxygenase-like lactoylglutathione lyase family enzyme